MTLPVTPGENKVHLIIENRPKKDHLSPTTRKILQVTAAVLILLGTMLIVAGSAFLGVGALAAFGVISFGISTILLTVAPATIPLGLTAVSLGCNFLIYSEKRSSSSNSLIDKQLSLIS